MSIRTRRTGTLLERLGAPLTAHAALHALDRCDPLEPADVAAFLAHRSFPLVDPDRALFAFLGEADKVEMVRWINAGVDRTSFVRVPRSDLWLLSLPVHDGGRFEYKIAVERGGHEEWMLDPLNPLRAGDPFGENSVCRTHGYVQPAWTKQQGSPQGRIEPLNVKSEVFAEERGELLYLPPRYSKDAPYPLLVIHDGSDFVTYADLGVSLDNLIEAGDIPPLVAALVQTHDRMGEYPRGRRHARYLVHELLPAVQGRAAVSPDPARRVLLGASLGAVASLSCAFRFPGQFGGLVLQSGSFILDEKNLRQRQHPVFRRVARLLQVVQRAPDLPNTRAFVSTGELEGLAEENRALAGLLAQHGVDVAFKSAWDGHHWHNWRDQLRDGLMWVLNRADEPQ
ncbi:MAG: alpha/beta hydrolase-fold protein [Pseudomonadota bacterium]